MILFSGLSLSGKGFEGDGECLRLNWNDHRKSNPSLSQAWEREGFMVMVFTIEM